MAKRVRRRRNRHLKRWVKVIIFIVVFLGLLGLISFFIIKKKGNNLDESNDTNDITHDNGEIDNLEEDREELNRVIYQDGFYYEELSSDIKNRITGKSFPLEFPSDYNSISYEDLRYVVVKYYDFDGKIHDDGELIVHKLVASDVVEIFYKLFLEKYPFTEITLVEKYDATDELSMRANNTSAFCYRGVEDGNKLAWHAFGLAIDINPLYNPYILGNEIYPSTATNYVNREADFPGKIDHDDLAYKIFKEYGWKWGGDFINSKDYQHFYKEALDDSVRQRKG